MNVLFRYSFLVFALLFIGGSDSVGQSYRTGKVYTDVYGLWNEGCVASSGSQNVRTNIPGGASINPATYSFGAKDYFWPITVTFKTPNYPGKFYYSLGGDVRSYTETVMVTDTPTVFNHEYNFTIPINQDSPVNTILSITNPTWPFYSCAVYREAIHFNVGVFPDTTLLQVDENDTSFTLAPGATRNYSLKMIGANTPGTKTFFTEVLWNGGQSYSRLWVSPDISIYDKINITYIDSIIIGGTSKNLLCPGASFNVPFTTIGKFNPGNTFTLQLSDQNGSFQSPVNIGSISGQLADSIYATIPLNTVPASYGYDLRIISSNPADTSSNYNTFPNNFPTIQIPLSYSGSVEVIEDSGLQICRGTPASFKAAISTEIPGPIYQWKINGINSGANSAAFNTTSLENGDVLTCQVSGSCPLSFTSVPLAMQVDSVFIPSVTITIEPGDSLCTNDSIGQFTTRVQNGGNSPVFQWYKNDYPVGDGGKHYMDSALHNTDQVYVKMTSGLHCAEPETVTSNIIKINRVPVITPRVHILTNPGDTICGGTGVLFYALPSINPELVASLQWYKNGNPVGDGTDEYIDFDLVNGDRIYVTLASSQDCAIPVNSNTITIHTAASVTPAISIYSDYGDVICPGTTEITFIATTRHAGDDPFFQWYKNGQPVGDGEDSYEPDEPLENGDVIYAELFSSEPCSTIETVTSEQLVMTVTDNLPVSVTITDDPAGAICTGTMVTFTASVINGGTYPVFQWKKNGIIVGSNSAVYSSNTLVSGDVILCGVTSSLSCGTTAYSNVLTMVVGNNPNPVVYINANPTGAICTGATVTYTAVYGGAGTAPSFQWKKNGAPVGDNSETYTTGNLAQGDIISCDVISNLPCVNDSDASNSISVIINPTIRPSISVTANRSGTICKGTAVTFTAATTYGGLNPTYQWKINGVNTGGNWPGFTSSTMNSGDVISCVMTSGLYCADPAIVVSNNIIMSVASNIQPAVIINVNGGNQVCAGTLVSFIASTVNAGINPTYNWKINGINTGINSATFSTILYSGCIVTCEVSSNSNCTNISTAISNAIVMSVGIAELPGITISTNTKSIVCPGSSITFNASTIFGGTSPSYQWKVNGVNVGSNSPVYSSSSLVNDNIVSCVLRSNYLCRQTTEVMSNAITVSMGNLTPAVSIVPSPGDPVCPGTTVVFKASPVNGGSNPSYQWKVNGNNAGTNSNSFSTSLLTNGNIVTCVMTSSSSCINTPTATSNAIVMNVGPFLPVVTINAGPDGPICAGTSVTFRATAIDGGSAPVFQWKKNGINVFTGAIYATSILANNDVISCVMTGNAACLTTASVTSNIIKMVVNTPGPPTINISVSPSDSICTGASVTFTANATNEGLSPVYQWKKNGVNISTGINYVTNTLINGDVINCTVTSNSSCVTTTVATSKNRSMTVKPQPVISIKPMDTLVCQGSSVSLKTSVVSGGFPASYLLAATASTGNLIGYPGAATQICDCPAGYVAVGYRGASGAWLDKFGLICKELKQDGTLEPALFYTATVGAPIGASNGEFNGGEIVTTGDRALAGIFASENQYTSFGSFMSSVQGLSLPITNIASGSLSGSTPIDQFGPSGLPLGTFNVPAGYVIVGIEGRDASTTGNIYVAGLKLRYAPIIPGNRNGKMMWSTGSTVYSIEVSPPAGINTFSVNFEQPDGCLATAETNIVVNPTINPSITIAANTGTNIVYGTPVIFTASVTDAGPASSFTWKKNGVVVGNGNNIYMDNTLVNDDMITCELSSNVTCVNAAFSNIIYMSVNAVRQTLCPGGGVNLVSNITGTSYQWQVNTGAGFTNISNNTNYSGVNSANLKLMTIPSGWYGYSYRCVVNGNNSAVSILRIVNIWEGSVNSAWEVPANWGCGSIPDGNTDVYINDGSVNINSNAFCRQLMVNPNVNFTVNQPYILTITH